MFESPWAHYEIIALTGYGRAEDRERAAEAGCDAFVLKPAELEELSQLIDAARTYACRSAAAVAMFVTTAV